MSVTPRNVADELTRFKRKHITYFSVVDSVKQRWNEWYDADKDVEDAIEAYPDMNEDEFNDILEKREQAKKNYFHALYAAKRIYKKF